MSRKRQFKDALLQKWTALIVVLVMAGFGLVQAVHVHEGLAGQTSHCSLCVVAHSAAIITPSRAAPVPLLESAVLTVAEPQLQSRLRVASSFIRPPPDNL
jgi:hypothetical protein